MIELTKKYKSGSALEILQEAILFGDITKYDSLTQIELAGSLGTSRMPVREALIALEYQGLIERQTNQHINAAPLTDEDIHVIFSDLAALECGVIEALDGESLCALAECGTQEEFHRVLCGKAGAVLRRKTLETLTEVYLSFVLANALDRGKADELFDDVKGVIEGLPMCDTSPGDLREVYRLYARVLGDEMIRIRRKRHAELEAG